jgi:pimeloyl-ACP methyl ester carboxylesterase
VVIIYLIKRIQGAIVTALAIILTTIVITTQAAQSLSMTGNALAYSMTTINSTTPANTSFLDNIEMKKVRVGDMDIAYKIFGKGEPLLLIPGFSMTMDMWDPIGLEKLSSNHTIIISDIRGIGKTTAGSNKTPPSIQLFANDTAGLIDALGIRKPIDILGLSMGDLLLELTLLHPDKVNRLIIYSSTCGGKETLPPQLSRRLAEVWYLEMPVLTTFYLHCFQKNR